MVFGACTFVTTASRSSVNSVAVWVLAVLAVVFFLRFARALLIPIAIATLISYALEPVVAWLQGWRIPRIAGATLAMFTTLGLLAWGGYGLRDDAKQIVQAVPKAASQAREKVMSQLGSPSGSLQQAVGAVGTVGGQESTAPAAAGGLRGSFVERIGSSLFELAGQVVAVFFLTLFLLISGHHVRNRIVEIAGPDSDRRRVTSTIIDDINAQIQRYLLVLLFTAAVVGVATWAVLAAMGVQQAPMWGMLAGVFNSIPYFGPVIVCGGLFVVGLMQGGGMTQALQMAGAALAITSLEGWVLTPPLMGKAEHMSALAVFLGLLLWTWIWGGWGTILAVPMLVVVKSVADHVDRFKPLGRLLAP
jgi:predicted PurR-regulated permease PerM